MIFTFPIWIGIFGGLFGIAAGLFGACIGIIGAVFGVIFGIIGSVFSLEWSPFPFMHVPGFRFVLIVAFVFLIVLLSRSKKKS
jgi:phosphotransferase system  glucose/maltose/N-acetylglucosamine-specific IIC component